MGPRRAIPVTAAVAPLPSLVPPPPPSPLIQKLRTDWRWAGISQFVWTFSDAFGLLDWDIETLEAEMDRDEMEMTPDLIAKMLYALTYNRQINRDNAFEHLRKQYAKRRPDRLIMGTEEEPRQWSALGLGEKVEVLWDLCEWQMADPARFRALLKGEEEAVAWRIEPVGWDKEGNTYFLFDDNRLWVQRLRPAPPRAAKSPGKKSAQKAKRSLNKRRALPDPSPDALAAASSSTPRPKSHKKKRAPSPDLTPPPPVEEDTPVSGHRRRAQVAFYGNPVSTVAALKRGGIHKPASETPSGSKITRSSSRGGLAAVPPPEEDTAKRPTAKATAPTSQPRGTRASRRARDTGDEWQEIPAEWLEPEAAASREKKKTNGSKANGKKKAVELESELSSLTDEVEEPELDSAETRRGDEEEKEQEGEGQPAEEEDDVKGDETFVPDEEADVEEAGEDAAIEEKVEEDEDVKEVKVDEDVEMKVETGEEKPEAVKEEEEEEMDEVKLAVKEAADVPEGFVEWEAVCVTLYDWRTFPERFAKSRDADEKNLYTLLVEHVGPTVIQALVEKEQERLRQEAINNRKRSSRIATKELEKEEIARRQKAEREMEERMEKSRREENAKLRAETSVISQEKAREDRLKEREDRIAAREIAAAQKAEEEQRAKDKADRARIRRQRRREGEVVETSEESEGEGSVRPSAKRSRVSTPTVPQKTAGVKRGADEGWELNCEICRKTGWNLNDGEDVVSCDDCGRWQHTGCHDKQDASEGRPPRNWDKVDFKCKDCRRKAARKRQRLSHEPRSSPLASTPLYTNGHANGIHPPVNFGSASGRGPSAGSYPPSNGHRPPPSVFQNASQGQPQMQPRPAGYASQHPQQYPLSSHPGYAQHPHPQQYPPQGYRPLPQQLQHSMGGQPHAYPIHPSQYAAQHQYAHYVQGPVNRQHTGPAPHQGMQNGTPGPPRSGSGSGPSLQGRPNGPNYTPYNPQPNPPAQSAPRPQQVHTTQNGLAQYAHSSHQQAQHQRPIQQHLGQPTQHAAAQSAPRAQPAQHPGSVASLLNGPVPAAAAPSAVPASKEAAPASTS